MGGTKCIFSVTVLNIMCVNGSVCCCFVSAAAAASVWFDGDDAEDAAAVTIASLTHISSSYSVITS